VAALSAAAGFTTAAAVAVNVVAPVHFIPYTGAIGGGIFALALMAGARFTWRSKIDRQRRPRDTSSRLLILGAGEATAMLLAGLLRAPESPYLPVGLLDDDPAKRRLRIRGVPVVGTSTDIAAAASALGADTLLIAIATAQAELIRYVTHAAEGAGLAVKVLPPLSKLIDNRVAVEDIRPVTITDLLGRREVDTDLAAIAGYLTGRRVLVTGAGGSIGSELCRQIDRFAPGKLIMLDRDESALHAVQLSIEGRALLDSDSLVLADLRDAERIHEILREHRPQVVFHAAALKHLTLLERQPAEALKTNVLGTLTMLQASAAVGVERFVNISTDKAADPSSVLGSSKRLAERLTAHVATETGGTYLSVRFGNVLGSRGSVLSTFQAQARMGGPITVTHRDVTRYFMTVEEAVQLTIQAGAIGRDGEVLVLDMGIPVRITEVAERIAAGAERAIEIVYTGLRPGEKLHEVLVSREERGVKRGHALISHVDVPPLEPLDVQRTDWSRPGLVSEQLRELCNYQVFGSGRSKGRA
jgi:FlaA1/EpsC-like NDP-sugar epimerase